MFLDALQKDDLASFHCEWVTPLRTDYHGWDVYELPPNGQGIGALMMLNLMEQFPIAKYGHNSADAIHVEVGTFRASRSLLNVASGYFLFSSERTRVMFVFISSLQAESKNIAYTDMLAHTADMRTTEVFPRHRHIITTSPDVTHHQHPCH